MALQGLASASRIPSPNDKVYKDECFFSFDNPVSPPFCNIIFKKKYFQHNFSLFRNAKMDCMSVCIRFSASAENMWKNMPKNPVAVYFCIANKSKNQ